MIAGSFQTNRLMNYPNQPPNNDAISHCGQTNNFFYRPEIISKLQKEHSLISMITQNLSDYYETIRKHNFSSKIKSNLS